MARMWMLLLPPKGFTCIAHQIIYKVSPNIVDFVPMDGLTLAQLRSIDAVVSEGSLQAAALRLGRTHPTLHTAITNVERQIGFRLFDRAGYRMVLTPAGEAFLARARRVLTEMKDLQVYTAQLAAGEESELRVVIGDLSPLPEMLSLLRDFFEGRPATRLHLQFAAISEPWELLMEDRADLILHHVDQSDPRFETIDLRRVRLIPVGSSMPHKHNAARRHHIGKMKFKVTNWAEYDAGLRQRGSLTLWVTSEAVDGWAAPRRKTRGGQSVIPIWRLRPP
jgi:DNA-binding transcriptional LysR family regulator